MFLYFKDYPDAPGHEQLGSVLEPSLIPDIADRCDLVTLGS